MAGVVAAVVIAMALPAHATDGYDALDTVTSDIFEARVAEAPTAVSVLMSPADVRRYRRIFEVQNDGRMEIADQLIRRLNDHRLMGHVLFQRFMHPDSEGATYADLSGWMAAYADHPDARRVHSLAVSRHTEGAEAPMEPRGGPRVWGTVEAFGLEPCGSGSARSAAERSAQRHIADLVGRTMPTEALNWLQQQDTAASLTDVEFDRALADVAAGYYYAGYPDRAFEEAMRAADRSGGFAPRSMWIAGLSAWAMEDYSTALPLFRSLASARCADAWERTAGAFWAARVRAMNGDNDSHSQWLAVAASYPHTFYGLIARRILGLNPHFSFDAPDLSGTHLALVNATPRGNRAIGLLQVGLTEIAAAELNALIAEQPSATVRDGVIAIAQESRLAALSLDLGGAITSWGGALFDGSLYPLPSFEPTDGYYVDRALILATMRQESRFDPEAVSHAGATGLMQLMPATAQAMADRHADLNGALDPAALELTDPAINVELGQAYFRQLMATRGIGDDLIAIVAGYNAGPGNVRRWLATLDNTDDPFFFIESIPRRETRDYVKRVLANYWIYRNRLDQQTPSLDAIARGDRPRYSSQESVVTEVADGHGAN